LKGNHSKNTLSTDLPTVNRLRLLQLLLNPLFQPPIILTLDVSNHLFYHNKFYTFSQLLSQRFGYILESFLFSENIFTNNSFCTKLISIVFAVKQIKGLK